MTPPRPHPLNFPPQHAMQPPSLRSAPSSSTTPLDEVGLRRQLTSNSSNSSSPVLSGISRNLRRLTMFLLVAGLLTGGVLVYGAANPSGTPFFSSLASWFPSFGGSDRKLEGLVVDRVRRGPFRITVTERGTLDAIKNTVLASKVEGTSAIISIIPEGTHVRVGDLICELDSSTLVEKETQQQISVTQAEASLRTAKEAVEIQKTQNDSDIAAAQLALRLSELDLKKFKEGDLEQQKAELNSQVTLSQEKRAQAEENYEFTLRLVKKGYKTQSELESARITLQTEDINLKIAKGRLHLLETYDAERTLTELEAKAQENARELERVRRKAAAALSTAEADLASRQLTYDVEMSKHNRLRDQIANCKIYATQDGQVIYANSRDGRGSDQVLIEVGSNVRERQPIVNLPDLSSMKVNARIHESRISLIRAGLPAAVRVDAFADRPFEGRVDTVASVPSSTGSFMTRDLKEYEAVVRLLGNAEEVGNLRPGLTAEIEVLVSSRENVLQAPIQSIVTVVGRQVAFVISRGKAEMRTVKIGATNDRMIEILEGLNEGDQVVMNPRSSFEAELKELEEDLIKQQAAENQKAEGSPAGSVPETPVLPMSPPAATPPAGSEGRPAFDPITRFREMDKNGDGKLSSDEWSERFAANAPAMDTNGDGVVSLEEYQTGMANRAGRGGPGGPGSGRPPGSGGAPVEQAGGG